MEISSVVVRIIWQDIEQNAKVCMVICKTFDDLCFSNINVDVCNVLCLISSGRIELGDVTPHNIKQLRKLNSVIFPVSYNDKVRPIVILTI